jgi:hypothetical protein
MMTHRDHKNVPVRVEVLVSANGPDRVAAAALHNVVVAVVKSPDLEIRDQPVPDWWLASGIALPTIAAYFFSDRLDDPVVSSAARYPTPENRTTNP